MVLTLKYVKIRRKAQVKFSRKTKVMVLAVPSNKFILSRLSHYIPLNYLTIFVAKNLSFKIFLVQKLQFQIFFEFKTLVSNFFGFETLLSKFFGFKTAVSIFLKSKLYFQIFLDPEV